MAGPKKLDASHRPYRPPGPANYFTFGALTRVLALIVVTGSTSVAQAPSNDQLANAAAWGPSSRGFQLGIVRPSAAYTTGKPIDIVTLVKNDGPSMEIEPLEPYKFRMTLIDTNGKQLALNEGQPGLNTTGLTGEAIASNRIIRNDLRIDQLFKLAPGAYRLAVSINIYEGSSFNAPAKPVYAHLTSPTVTINVLP